MSFINVLAKMIVSIGCTVVIFHSYKPAVSKNTLYWISRYPGWQERNLIIDMQKLFKQTNTHNIEGDVALMNITWETNFFHDLLLYPFFYTFEQYSFKSQLFSFHCRLRHSTQILMCCSFYWVLGLGAWALISPLLTQLLYTTVTGWVLCTVTF